MSLLTLVLPTKDRQEYVEQVAYAYIELMDSRISLVIHDNSAEAMTSEIIDAPGVTYIHYPDALSMHQNFTRAISHVKTKYLCISGDDDFFCHYVCDVMSYLERNDVDVIVAEKTGRFWWTDVNHRLFGNFFAGQLRLPWHRTQLRIKTVSTKAALHKCLKSGGTEIGMMPKAYHGIVATRLMQSFEETYGSAFPGPTPDMACSTLLALTLESFHQANLPFFISGTARGSAGGKGVSKQHKWKLEDVPWFDKKYLAKWHAETPQIACGPSLWAEGVLQAHEAIGRKAPLNWSALYARVLATDGFATKSLSKMAKMSKSTQAPVVNLVLILLYYLRYQAKRSVSLLENLTFLMTGLSWSGKVYGHCASPIDVVRIIRSHEK
jgi:hypothetical protein